MKKIAIIRIWGPILQAILRRSANHLKMEQFGGGGGVCQSTKIEQFEKLSKISCTNSKMKGGHYYQKNADACILGPMLLAILDIWGVYQLAQNSPIKFYFYFLYKIQIERGSILRKK